MKENLSSQVCGWLLPLIGQEAVDAIKDELQDISESHDGWRKAVLALVADAVGRYGPQGIAMAVQAIQDIADRKAPDIAWADLRAASDVLAALQNAEADQQSDAQEFLAKLSRVLGTILSALLGRLL